MRRRQFLTVSATAGGGLLLGFSWGCKQRDAKPAAPATAAPAAADEPVASHDINAWIRIDTDDTVTCIVPESEMGQGVLTSIPMILAEELDADWARVRSEHAPADAAKYGRQSTGGSTSIRMGYPALRLAGAKARQMLIAAAAQTWSVPAEELTTDAGAVVHAASERRASYGSLAATAATLEPPADPPLREPKKFRLIGKPLDRLDLAGKVDGSAVFGIDVVRPNMLVAAIARPPLVGGTPTVKDDAAALEVPGVRDVVTLPTGVAVLADHFWAAKQGRDALVIEWDLGAHAKLDNAAIEAELKRVVSGGVEARAEGDASQALGKVKPKRALRATYRAPYLAHVPMEPLSCTAEITADGVALWTSTQAPSNCQRVASEITGLPPDKVTVHNQLLGGGFGRRSQVDYVADAIHAAKAAGRPVKIIYTREDDVQGGFYRPIAYNELRGAVGDDGMPLAWEHRIASPSILEAFGPLRDGIDGTAIEGAANLPYAIPHLRVTYAKPTLPISTWFWRSVGSSQNAWVTECFFDELVKLGGLDPVEARRKLLADHPRHLRVLDVAADKAGWGKALPDGVTRGVAVHESFGSVVAQVAEVSVDGGVPKVHRVVCAVDCGDVINPDTVEAQMESGIAYGLSAALYGRIDVAGGRAVQSNFHDYRAVRIHEMPKVEVHIANAGDPLGGVGEPGLPPIAPAVCNAMLAATGEPVRTLPIVS